MISNNRSVWVATAATFGIGLVAVVPNAQAFDFKVSGQVSRAVVAADNGEDTDYGFVDNNGSGSRFRFTGSQTMPNDLKVGFVYEFGILNSNSTSFDINDAGDSSDNVFNDRFADLYIAGDFGKFSFGKGDGAANGTSEVDLSGTDYLGGGSEHYYASGITFIGPGGDSLANASGSANIGNAAYNNFDGLSRQNRLRYDSPSYNNFVFSASLDNNHAYETALRYANTFAGGTKLEAAIDYLDSEELDAQVNPIGDREFSNRFQEYGGSASVLLPSGLNFTGMYKNRDASGDTAGDLGQDASTYFGGIGYILGDHHVQVGWGHSDDLANEGSNGNSYQVAYEYDWGDSIDLFASYHLLTLDDFDNTSGDRVDAEDINYVFAGARIKFF